MKIEEPKLYVTIARIQHLSGIQHTEIEPRRLVEGQWIELDEDTRREIAKSVRIIANKILEDER